MRINNFKLEIKENGSDSINHFIETFDKHIWSVYYFRYTLRLGEYKSENEGNLLISVKCIIDDLVSNHNDFFSFDDGARYYLKIKQNEDFFDIGLGEGRTILKRFSIPRKIFISCLIRDIKDFLNKLKVVQDKGLQNSINRVEQSMELLKSGVKIEDKAKLGVKIENKGKGIRKYFERIKCKILKWL